MNDFLYICIDIKRYNNYRHDKRTRQSYLTNTLIQ